MSYCENQHCSTPLFKPLTKAHVFLCTKSKHYHNWHLHPHHKKVHFGILATSVAGFILLMFSIFGFPHFGKAAESFRANFDGGSLNADYSVGVGTASNDGTPATITNPGYNSSTGAVTVSAGQTLRYPVANNLDNAKGEIEMKFQLPYDLKGDRSKGGTYSQWGISFDVATGYIYLADNMNNRIIKTKIDGTDWTEYGSLGANIGQFNRPAGLYYDSVNDYIYISDSVNNRIVRTRMDGTGWATIGGVTNPAGVWYDAASAYLYIVEAGNNRIVKMKFDGTSRTNFGAVGAGVNQFNAPAGLSYDATSDYIFIADTTNSRVIKTKIDGTGWTSLAVAGRTRGVSYDAVNDYVYITYYTNDWDNGMLLKSKIDGTLQTSLNVGGSTCPKSLFYDSTTGDIYVARGRPSSEMTSSVILKTKIDGTGQVAYGFTGMRDDTLVAPHGIFLDQPTGDLYITDTTSQKIFRTKWDYSSYTSIRPVTSGMTGNPFYVPSSDTIYASNGDCVSGLFRVKPDGSNYTSIINDGCSRTTGIYVDSTNSLIYRTQRSSNRLAKTNLDGINATYFGTNGSGVNQFSNPYGVWYDQASDYLYIADTGNNRIVKTKFDGTGWTTLGGPTSGAGVNQFNSPRGIFYNPADDYIYVTDLSNNRIVKTKITGEGWTTLGTGGSGTSQFSQPQWLTVNTNTNDIYVTDYYNKRVVKTKIDGSGWATMGGDSTKTLLKTSGTYPMSIKVNSGSGKFGVFLSDGQLPYYLQSTPQTITAGTWHTIKVTYNNSSGVVTMLLDGTQIGNQTFPAWTAPDIGANFYIGSDPVVANAYRALTAPIDEIKLTSIASDAVAPTNPTTLSVLNQSGGTEIANQGSGSGNWYKHPSPVFNWSGSTDNDSGVKDYWVYWGISNDPSLSDPQTHGTAQTGTSYAPASLVSGQTYYLKIKTRDNAYNVSAVQDTFTYKYENQNPSNLTYVAVSPSTWTPTNSYTFYWQDNRTDTGGSGFSKYRYKINNGSWNDLVADDVCAAGQCQVALADIASDGLNVFHLESIDNASNESSEVTTNFYFALNASGVRNLTASPPTTAQTPAPQNDFSFTWDVPLNFSESITKYYYSVNNYPTEYNTLYTSATSLPTDHYATKQGENILYVVAEDATGINFNACLQITGNPDNDRCASIKFYTQTSAPSVPLAFQLRDTSVRDLQEYSINLRWATPTETGAGFAGYEIYRAEGELKDDGTVDPNSCGAFESTATTVKKAYADTDLESIQYCFYVKAKDNAGQYSIPTNTLYVKPTGDYTSSPSLKSGSVQVTTRATSAIVSWTTEDVRDSNHKANTIVKYGKEQNNLDKEISSATVFANEHSIAVQGLEPETTYFYKLVWMDINGNTGESDILQLLTNAKPTIANVKTSNIALTTAAITLDSTTEANLKLYYSQNSSDFSTSEPLSEATGSYGTSHVFNLSGLSHSTKYYFKVTGYDKSNDPITSDSYDFQTLTMPRITDDGVKMDQDALAPTTTYRFSWTTNIPTTSVLNYQDEKGSKFSQSDVEYVTAHNITIANLADMSTYAFEAIGTDSHGNIVENPFQSTVKTPNDTRPPVISSIVIESSNVGNASDKAQVAISWKTDEPSDSQIEYDTGLSGTEYTRKTALDRTFSNHHLIIISDLDPGKPYHLRVLSADMAGNSSKSGDNTVISGEVSKSALNMIINTMQSIFGWMGNWIK